MPRLYPIEVTMGSPSVMIIDGRRAAFFRPSTGQGSDRAAGQVGLRAERSAGILGDPFGEGQHILQGDDVDGWGGFPDVVGDRLQPLLPRHPRALGANAHTIQPAYGRPPVAGVPGNGY